MNHPDNKHDEWSKEKIRKNPTKSSGPRVKGIVIILMELLEAKNASLYPPRYIIYYALTV